uniref:Uncharacterized protein n=1 Tax=Pristionchus pacificus TaxID=54126 RepID=A0A8R1UMW8_PRIPA
MNDGTRVLIRGLFAFINTTFLEFQGLRENEKWLLVGKYEMIFHCIDSVLRLKKKFGNDSAKFFFSYTSYMSHEFMERFFVNCPERANVVEAKKTLHVCFEDIVTGVRTLINQIDPTDDEFFAIIGLAFWSVESLDVSDDKRPTSTDENTFRSS